MAQQVNWLPDVKMDEATISALSKTVDRLLVRKRICDARNCALELMYSRWGDVPDIKSAFTYVDSKGHRIMHYAPNTFTWKNIVTDYCKWHDISSLDQLVDFWCCLVDTFLLCEEFFEPDNTEFRDWSYGCMCKFVLEKRRNEYDPGKPYIKV